MIGRFSHRATRREARFRRGAEAAMLLQNSAHEVRVRSHGLGVNVVERWIRRDRAIEQRLSLLELTQVDMQRCALYERSEEDEARRGFLYSHGLVDHPDGVRVVAAQNVNRAGDHPRRMEQR